MNLSSTTCSLRRPGRLGHREARRRCVHLDHLLEKEHLEQTGVDRANSFLLPSSTLKRNSRFPFSWASDIFFLPRGPPLPCPLALSRRLFKMAGASRSKSLARAATVVFPSSSLRSLNPSQLMYFDVISHLGRF